MQLTKLVVGLSLALGFVATAAAQTTMRISISTAQNSHQGVAIDTFAKEVEKRTGGRYKIQTFYNGALGGERESIEAVQLGTQELAFSSTGPVPNFVPETKILDVPFLFRDKAHARAVLDGPIGQDLLSKFDAKGFKALAWAENGFRHMTNSKRDVKEPGDLKGLKMRIPGLGGRLFSAVGAVPQQIPGGDIYPALERGTIDAAEWVGPYDDEKLGFYQVAKNYYYPGWWEPGVTMGLLISMDAYNELPPAYQEILQSVCGETFADRLAAYDHANPLALQRLVNDHGVVVREYPQDIMDAAWRESNAYLEEQAAADATFRQVFESYRTFRDAQWSYAQGNELAYQVSAFNRV